MWFEEVNIVMPKTPTEPDPFEEEVEPYWMDDLYQLNQNEADDYRHEFDGCDEE